MRFSRCLAFLLSTALLAGADVLPPTQDTSSTGGKLTLANGKATTLAVSGVRRSFVYFDLANLPGDVLPGDIAQARLRIYFPSALKPGDLTLHTVTPGATLWSESATAAVAEPAIDATPIATILKASVVAKKFVEIDVTPTVRNWLAGTPANFGFAFRATGVTSVTLGAKEGPGTGYPCMLEIEIDRQTDAGSIGTAELTDLGVTSPKLALDLTLGGTTTVGAALVLPPTAGGTTGVILQGGESLLHSFGYHNFYAGGGAGNFFLGGGANTGNGYYALHSNTAGSENTAAGALALAANTTGDDNTAAGALALNYNTTGRLNTASGAEALQYNGSGANNTAAGFRALQNNTVGHDNTASGCYALSLNVSGNANVALGGTALHYATGSSNIALGFQAGINLTTGNSNIAIGHAGAAGESGIIRIGTPGSQTDTYLTGVIHGDGSGLSLSAPSQLVLPATDANGTTGVIRQAGSPLLHTFGTQNFFAGPNAGNFTTTGIGQNVGIGDSALSANTTGAYNVALGYTALTANTTGYANQAIGWGALQENTTGYANSAFGQTALVSNTSGTNNVAVGNFALLFNTTGTDNSAVGINALQHLTEGSGNVAVGSRAGASLTTGLLNIFLGVDAGGALTTGNHNIMIGTGGEPADDGTIRIGEGIHQRAFIAGTRGHITGVNDAVPVVIDSTGQLGTISSSRRYKEDIADMGDTSARLLALRPVTFHYKKPYANGEKPVQFGLIAEEVAAAFPELAVFNAEGQPETVKYQDLTPMLLNEVQKQQRRADAKDAEISELKKESAGLRARLEKVEAAVERMAK